MMNFKKGLSALLLASTVSLASLGSAVAEQVSTPINAYYAPIHFEFDGKYLVPPETQQGFIYENSTYVPLRFVANSLDKAVDWNQDTYTVTIREPNKVEQVTIKEYKMNREVQISAKLKVDASMLKPTSIPVYFEKVTYIFNGEEKVPSEDLPGLIYDGSLYVPMRFVSESIGKEIGWDSETYTIKASTTGKGEAPEAPEATPSPTPSPNPTPTPVPGAGGSGGAVTPSKPSLDSLVFSKGLELMSIKSNAESVLRGYEASYKAATTDAERAAIKSQAKSYVAQVTSDFYSNMAAYKSTLIGYGYETSSVTSFENAFEKSVSEESAKVGQ